MPRTTHQVPNQRPAWLAGALVLSGAIRAEAAPQPETPQATSEPVAFSAASAVPSRGSPGSEAASAGLQSWRRQYDDALAKGLFGEAEAIAKRMLETLLGGGAGQPLVADGLARLAFAQRQQQLYEAAVQNYAAAVDLLRSTGDHLSSNLIPPLRGLGDTYVASGRADMALPVYEQALHIRHVNDGPHTLEQVELLDDIAVALERSGGAEAALVALDRMFSLYARAYAADSEEVLPVLGRKAGLLNALDRHQEERAVYREITTIIRSRRGEYDLSLLQPYSALGRTYFHDLDDAYFRSEPTTETGETFLRKALEVTERNAAATWAMQTQALIELGDYYTLRDVQDRARIQYGRAWELLSADADRLDRRRRELGQPIMLLRPPLDASANFGYRSDANAEPAEYKDGHVVARFTVNERGRAVDLEIVDADPRNFSAMETRVRQAVRGFIFRPRYDAGRPASTPGHEFRHEFRYLPGDLDGYARP